MTSSNPSIPDGFSMADLQKLAQQAAEAAPEQSSSSSEGKDARDYSPEEIMAVADRLVNKASDEICDPAVHKAMMLRILSVFIEWHSTMGSKVFEEGDAEAGTCWLRDAGKFQAMMQILVGVSVGPNDAWIEQ